MSVMSVAVAAVHMGRGGAAHCMGMGGGAASRICDGRDDAFVKEVWGALGSSGRQEALSSIRQDPCYRLGSMNLTSSLPVPVSHIQPDLVFQEFARGCAPGLACYCKTKHLLPRAHFGGRVWALFWTAGTWQVTIRALRCAQGQVGPLCQIIQQGPGFLPQPNFERKTLIQSSLVSTRKAD
jgi:hypothetical protein